MKQQLSSPVPVSPLEPTIAHAPDPAVSFPPGPNRILRLGAGGTAGRS